MEALGDRPPPLPPVAFGDHLIGFLMEVGPVSSNGMVAVPVSFAELKAWESACEQVLSGWEFQTLHAMSVGYASERQKAESPNAPPPWSAPVDDEKKQRLVSHIKNVLRD